MNARAELGRKGEAIAARFLEKLGYRIREKNYRCAIGEIDLIATTEEYLIFVEVKTRTAGKKLHPSLSVTGGKQRKVREVGEHYCSRHPQLPLQPRFDVISVEVGKDGEQVEHIVNAF